jgi:ribonucleotide monophosphatase NagD (HAD superfamily)
MSATSKPLPKRKKTASAQKVLAVDFDGVIFDPATNTLLPGALDYLNMLTRRFKVIIFSSRAATPAGAQFIRDLLQYHLIRVAEVTPMKPLADLYIDDKAVHHTDWEDTLQQISQRLNLSINLV